MTFFKINIVFLVLLSVMISNKVATFKVDGIRALIKKEGWSIVAIFFLFYLIRDSIIYILIPYIGISSLSSCF